MEKIISKAIEGGYFLSKHIGETHSSIVFTKEHICVVFIGSSTRNSGEVIWNEEREFFKYEKIILDPTFWVALGKACKWNTNMDYRSYTISSGNPDLGVLSTEMRAPRWLFESIRFHEINLTESFEKAVEYLQTLIDKN